MTKTSAPGSTANATPQTAIHVFCEDQTTANLIQTAAKDRRLAQTHISIQMGGVHTACAHYTDAPTPGLLIVESLLDRPTMFSDLERLAEVCDGGTKVIVIGHINDALLYRELLRRHISDYLVAPFDPEHLIESITSVFAGKIAAPLGKVIAFIGARGGAGSSTVCHNAAWVLAETLESETVIADFDLAFGTAGLDFNQDAKRGIGDALGAAMQFDNTMLGKLLLKCSQRLSLLTAPCLLTQDVEIQATSAAQVADVLSRVTPFVALDLPRDWGAWARQLISQADEIVITAEPDLASLRNTKNLVDAVAAMRGPGWVPVLVLNKVGVPRRPEITLRDFANAVEVKPSVVIGFDAQLFGLAANNGQMIGEVAPKAKVAEAFRELAALLAGKPVASKSSDGLLAPLVNRLSRKFAS